MSQLRHCKKIKCLTLAKPSISAWFSLSSCGSAWVILPSLVAMFQTSVLSFKPPLRNRRPWISARVQLGDNWTYSWSVPVVISRVKIRLVLELLLQRELVELLAKGELTVDGSLGDTVVDDVEETLGADDLDKGLGESGIGFWGRVVEREVDSREFCPVQVLLGLGDMGVLVRLGDGDGHCGWNQRWIVGRYRGELRVIDQTRRYYVNAILYAQVRLSISALGRTTSTIGIAERLIANLVAFALGLGTVPSLSSRPGRRRWTISWLGR